MSQISLSNDLIEITAEINSFKQVAGQAVFEIGKRLKHVKENDLVHGQWEAWLKSIDVDPSTARRMISAFEQFGNRATSHDLPTGKIFEMLSLPETIDRQEFVEKSHIIPSTGEEKKVDEMTVRELREVKKSLQAAEKAKEQALSTAMHFEKLWNQTKNQPPKVVYQTKEVVPENLKKKLQKLEIENNDLQAGYKQAQEKIELLRLAAPVDEFDETAAERQRRRLQYEADKTVLELCIKLNRLAEPLAITSYMTGALIQANEKEKRQVWETVNQLEDMLSNIKAALQGRKVGEVI